MKKGIKIIIAAVLTLITVLTLIGCKENGTEVETSAQESETAAAETEEQNKNVIIAGGESEYQIIRSSYAGSVEIGAAVSLNKTLNAKISTWKGSIYEDFEKGVSKGGTVENDKPEIIVGNTNRAEGQTVYAGLSVNQFRICVSNKKLLIVGASEYATAVAVDYLIENYINKGIVEFAPDFVYEGIAGDTAKADEIRLMSWNLGCDVGKAEDVLVVVEKYMPDILSFQECNSAEHSKVFQVFMKAHTNYKYAQKTHNKSATLVYTPIIYNKDKLTLVEAGVEWLDSRYTGTNTKSLCYAVFDDKNGNRFMSLNFHGAVVSDSYTGYENMTSAERSALANTWRIDNVRQVLDVCAKVYEKYGQLPTTVNGDCNFNKESVPYANLISAGFSDAEFTAKVIMKTGLKTSYSYGNKPGSGLPIDHIFGKNGIVFNKFDIINDDNAFSGADHYPIIADMEVQK